MTVSLYDRFKVMKRDRFTCVYCGAHPPNVELEIDHFYPVSRGGSDHPDNRVTACFECNRGKSATSWDEFNANIPDPDSPLWKWVERGVEYENERIRDRLLNREDYGFETFADVVQSLWPEADY